MNENAERTDLGPVARRQGTRWWRPPTICLMLLAAIAVAPLTGCDWKWTYWYNPYSGWFFFYIHKWIPITLDDYVIGALVVPNKHDVTGFQVKKRVSGEIVPTDSAVSSAHQALIEAELISLNIYQPADEYLLFYRTTEVVAPSDQEEYEVSFCLTTSGKPAYDTVIAGGATDQADLDDGTPLSNFAAVEQAIADTRGIPTVSEWGLIVLALLLVVAGAIMVRRHRRMTAGGRAA